MSPLEQKVKDAWDAYTAANTQEALDHAICAARFNDWEAAKAALAAAHPVLYPNGVKFSIINGAAIAVDEFAHFVDALTAELSDFVSAWNFGDVTLINAGSGNAAPGTWPVHISLANRHDGAGWHGKDANGIPFAWVLPGTDFSRFGVYRAPFNGRSEYMRMGSLGVALHEIAEMLADPLVATKSAPDAQGRQLLREIADPTEGVFKMKLVGGVPCIFPAITLPAWWTLGSSGPWDSAGASKAAFTFPSHLGRAFYFDAGGHLTAYPNTTPA